MNRHRTAGGWILLETIVAMIVLSIGVVAVNRAISEALVTRAMARDYTQARFLLEQKIAEVQMRPVLVAGTKDQGPFGDAFPRFSWSWRITAVEMPMPALPDTVTALAGLRFTPPVRRLGRLAVTVKWTRKGNTYERTLETLLPPERFVAPEEDELRGRGAARKAYCPRNAQFRALISLNLQTHWHRARIRTALSGRTSSGHG